MIFGQTFEFFEILSVVQKLIVAISMIALAVPLTLNAIRWRGKGELAPLRTKSVFGSIGIAIVTIYTLVIRVDFVFFDQGIFGTIQNRYIWDIIAWLPLTIYGPIYVFVYWESLREFAKRGISRGNARAEDDRLPAGVVHRPLEPVGPPREDEKEA